METSARHHYELTTPRIVLMVVAIVLWLLAGLMRLATLDDSSAGYKVGALLGALLIGLLISWIVRSLFRLVTRRPVMHPAWTPGLFFGAALVTFLSAAGQLGDSA